MIFKGCKLEPKEIEELSQAKSKVFSTTIWRRVSAVINGEKKFVVDEEGNQLCIRVKTNEKGRLTDFDIIFCPEFIIESERTGEVSRVTPTTIPMSKLATEKGLRQVEDMKKFAIGLFKKGNIQGFKDYVDEWSLSF